MIMTWERQFKKKEKVKLKVWRSWDEGDGERELMRGETDTFGRPKGNANRSHGRWKQA